MKERGKTAIMETNNFSSDFNYSISSDMPCKKHPSSSSIGICSYCLKEKLVNLVCSECGEQRLSSCSCSDSSSSNRKSCTTDIGSVGRVYFLLENENSTDQYPQQKKQSKRETREQVIVLRRSSSSCVEIKKSSNGFWKIKRLFTKKKKKGVENCNDLDENNSDIWVNDATVVSRSRSVCSFRGGGFNNTDEGSDYRFSSAKISDVTGGILMDSDEPRKSGFRSIFPFKESDFSTMDDSAFIDLKLDLSSSSESRSDFPPVAAMRLSNASDNGRAGLDLGELKTGPSPFGHSGSCRMKLSNASDNGRAGLDLGGLRTGPATFGHSGSCRMTVNEYDRGIKRSGNKGNKVWKWIFRQSSTGRKSTSINRDENDMFKS
ncbi:hypothetical protein K7X08_001171 [Anisodus acutangulus]|uniref:Uncharacterized protein n=1 Tax=Anisodus acutangulus TaxID=402998 RepID=A0A9Q1RN98_9SOLA|nr:hypothetical protein K7X08_001171 [Anisodus acutangulus]